MDMILDFPQLAVAICKSVVTASMTHVIAAVITLLQIATANLGKSKIISIE